MRASPSTLAVAQCVAEDYSGSSHLLFDTYDAFRRVIRQGLLCDRRSSSASRTEGREPLPASWVCWLEDHPSAGWVGGSERTSPLHSAKSVNDRFASPARKDPTGDDDDRDENRDTSSPTRETANRGGDGRSNLPRRADLRRDREQV